MSKKSLTSPPGHNPWGDPTAGPGWVMPQGTNQVPSVDVTGVPQPGLVNLHKEMAMRDLPKSIPDWNARSSK